MAFGAQTRLTLLHVVHEEPLHDLDAIGYLHRALWSPNGFACEERDQRIHAKLLRDVHPEWRQSVTLNTAVRHGDVAVEIVRFAREHAVDLILVGVNRAGRRYSLRPRHSDQILRMTDRPAVVVHPAFPGPMRPILEPEPQPV
jgi:hypothetical protein